ncbi:MAG: hypothetical protein IPP01_05900 [Saprospiraceae bacterium]|nr:hypothetical protein [Saprospiraceae bacterium]
MDRYEHRNVHRPATQYDGLVGYPEGTTQSVCRGNKTRTFQDQNHQRVKRMNAWILSDVWQKF